MNEIWKPVKDFEKYYFVSNFGNVKNLDNQILKQRKNNRGYHILDLYKEYKKKTALVHRLVAEAFLKIPEGLKDEKRLQVNHIDGNKDNNNIANLEWCNQSHNMKEAYRLGLRQYIPHEVSDEYREKMRKLSSKPAPGKEVQMIDMTANVVLETFYNASEAKKKHPELNLNPNSIRDAANNRRGMKTYKGYIWKFTGKITNGNKCRESKKIKR